MPCNGRILIVDDDDDIREALRACLEQVGCTVVEASNGLEAMESLSSGPRPCFVLLDVNMPRLDGAGLVRLVRCDVRQRDVPIVSMSAGCERLEPPLVHSHVDKPFSMDDLTPTIEQLCQHPDWLHGSR